MLKVGKQENRQERQQTKNTSRVIETRFHPISILLQNPLLTLEISLSASHLYINTIQHSWSETHRASLVRLATSSEGH